MSNIYEKSLELMDAHFNSIEDDVFLSNYLSVEELKTTLVKEFLSSQEITGSLTIAKALESYSFNCYTEKVFRRKNIETALSVIKRHSISCTKYDSSFSTNDENYELCLSDAA
jgi:5-enolpyruvylshikimate-3-phosphate synthase